jgi:hypothetical protein
MSWRLALALGFVTLTALRGDAQGPSAGTGTIYVGSYSGHITAVDEASGTFTKIPLSSGPPFVVRLSPDKTRFYVQSANQEKFEVVDVAARKSVDAFTLSDGHRHVRALTFEADPQHRTLVLVTRTATKQIDRWEIGAPEFVVYDLATHTITHTVPWTIDDEPALYGVALRFSPDGKYLYVFGSQVTILDAATLQQVDSWDLSLPTDTSMSRFDAGPQDDSADRPGLVTGLFVTQDAVMKRRTLSVGQIDLAAKTVDVLPLGPVPEADGMSFTVAPGRKRANILLAEIGRHRLLSIDMEARRVTGQVDVPTRTRMQMRTGANGLLYLYEAGRTIEIFSADAATRLRTIELDSDMMYGTFTIVPGAAAPAARK